MPFIFAAWPLAGLTWIVFPRRALRRNFRIAREGRRHDGGALSPGRPPSSSFGTFFTLFILRVPVAFALGLACLPILAFEPRLSPMMLLNETFKAYNSFILLAVPFLPPHGEPHEHGRRHRTASCGLSRSMVGHFPGALAQINVLLSFSSPGSRARRRRMREPEQDLHRRAGEGGLRALVLDRHHGGLRGARGDHPALDPHDRLGRRDLDLDRRHVPRGIPAGLLIAAAQMVTVHVYAKIYNYPSTRARR
jgi:hypothetical protein